jgi:hypothetical protein
MHCCFIGKFIFANLTNLEFITLFHRSGVHIQYFHTKLCLITSTWNWASHTHEELTHCSTSHHLQISSQEVYDKGGGGLSRPGTEIVACMETSIAYLSRQGIFGFFGTKPLSGRMNISDISALFEIHAFDVLSLYREVDYFSYSSLKRHFSSKQLSVLRRTSCPT